MLYSKVAVSDGGSANNIGSANTSRNVDIDINGNIGVVYLGDQGLRFAKSNNRGQSFLPSVLLKSVFSGECEVNMADNKTIYVVFSDGSTISLFVSLDEGSTFSSEIVVGAGSTPHIASYGSSLYVVNQFGNTVYRNSNNGQGAFTVLSTPGSWAFSDIRTDRSNGDVYLIADNPRLFMYRSIDNCDSWVNQNISGQVFYSSYSITTNNVGNYIYTAGNGNVGYKITFGGGSATATTVSVGNNVVDTGRTLSSDSFGNFVDGYSSSSNQLKIGVSNDFAVTFPYTLTIDDATSQNVVINPKYQDINSVYSGIDGKIYLNVYSNYIAGLSLSNVLEGYCSGETSVINYNSVKTSFNSGNQFVVQLSDENRSFATPTVIGSLTSVASSGSIPITIPGTVLSGDKYRIRVISTDNSFVGVDNGFDISIPSIKVAGKGSIYYLDQAGQLTIDASSLDNGSTGCTSLTFSVTPETFDCTKLGPNVVTFTATDKDGKSASAPVLITVSDNQIPIITSNGDKNVNTDLNTCGAAVVVSATATDNCTVGAPAGVRSDGLALNAIYPVGTTTIKWNVSDVNSNAAVEVIQTVVVTDNQVPVIVSNGDKNVNTDLNTCGAVVNYSLPTVADNCSNGVFKDPLVNGSFENDYNGWTILSSVPDDRFSTFGILNAGQTISGGGILYDFKNNQNEMILSPGLPYLGAPTAGNKLAVFLQIGPGDHRMYQDVDLPNSDNLKLNFDLQYNNTSNAFDPNSQFFSVVLRDPTTDIIKAVIYKTQQGIDPLIMPMTTKTFDITGFKGQTVRLEIISANIQNSFFDILMDNVFISGSGNLIPQQTAGLVSGSNFPVGTTTNTFTATDASGNTTTTSFDVTVTDNQLPVITSNGNKNVNTDLNVCGATVVVSATALDNCSVGSPTGVRSDGLALDALYPVGTTTIKWNVSDANSNAAVEVIQTVVVTDNQVPVIVSNGDKNVNTDVNVCGAAVVVSATATDNCIVGAPAGVRSDALALNAIYPVGTTTIKWNVSDANSNSAVEVIQTVVVADNQAPVIVSNGDKNVNTDLNVCSATVVVSATAVDNCTIGLPTGVRSDGLALDALYPIGITTIAWNVSDANNNDAVEVTQTIVVTDNQLPIITSNGDKNVNTDLNVCGATVVVSASAEDNCSVVAPTGVRSDGKLLSAVYPVGTTTITWNVSDGNGNDAVAIIQTVTVVDNEAPVVVTKDTVIQLNAAGTASIQVADVNNGSTDNCGISLLELDKTSFTCANIGLNTVTLKVTDNNGNITSKTAVVTVEDKIAPVVITKNKTIQLNAAGAASIVVADVNNGSSDNCGISLVELDKMSFTCANVGANTVTLKVTDNNGNVATKTAIVTVEDKIAPIASTKNITVQLDASSNILIAAADVNNGSMDNCGISLLELDKVLFSCADVGENVVTLKVTDNSGNVSARTALVTIVDSQPNLIRKHFDDVIFFDNSSKAFIAYSWYKNGVLVPGQTAQYFKDNGILNGSYYAKATKVNGTVFTTCPLTFSASIVDEYLKIAPNPVKSYANYQILTNVDSAKLQKARITVFNALGALVSDKIVDNKIIDMIAPSAEGIYIVRMTLANGKYFTKNLLVKN